MFFTVRALILSAILLVFLLLLYNAELGELNSYARSHKERIGFYAERIDSFMTITSWKQRMLMRHVANAYVPTWIASNRRDTDVVLLPPMAYASRYQTAQAIWTDPRIFTYMAGFQPIVAWTDTARRHKANAFIALDPPNITLTRPGGSVNIDSLLKEYEAAERDSASLRSRQ